jgi:prevent-host-death family protein
METVTVAELKARLSHYLREVRAGGSFTVVSRDIPVATLSPHDPGHDDDLVVVEPRPDAPCLSDIDMGPPLPAQVAAVELIRQGRRDAGDKLAGTDDPERERLAADRPPAGESTPTGKRG